MTGLPQGLIGQPLSVCFCELVVSDQAALEAGYNRRPLAQLVGGTGQGKAYIVPFLTQVGVVWCRLRVGDLAVYFPCHIAFEAAYDFSLALTFCGPSVYIGLGPGAHGHAV